MSLAIFDLDNTLLGGDSDHAWGEFLIANNYVDSHSYHQANDLFYQQYQEGSLNIDEYMEFALHPLINRPIDMLKKWHDQFMTTHIQPLRLKKADELLRRHRDNGDYLLIITATNLFITKPIAELLAVDDILATVPELIDGRYTGRVAGVPCFQSGKVTRLQEWLKNSDQQLEGSYFYSDSHNDLPLLEIVDHPVAVDPDEKLRRHAQLRQWPIISLRDSNTFLGKKSG